MLKLFDVRGRASRSEYQAMLAALIGATVVQVLLNHVLAQRAADLTGLALGLAMLALFILTGIRRLHDLGRSGWLMLLWLVPMVGVVLFVWFAAGPGAAGGNRWGPSPAKA